MIAKWVMGTPGVIAQSCRIANGLDCPPQRHGTTDLDNTVNGPQPNPTIGRTVCQYYSANRFGDCDDLARNIGADHHDDVRTDAGNRFSDRRYIELHDRIVTPRLKVGGDVSNLIQVVTDKEDQRRT